MIDFTIKTYIRLLESLQSHGFIFLTFKDFITNQKSETRNPFPPTATQSPIVILRHDVDARKENSLKFAQIQHRMNISGTYYFRVVPQSYDQKVIEKIAEMGHEIGYHYETMDTVNAKCKMQNAKWNTEELIDRAHEEFCHNLEMFRKIVPIETICMHGSPRSKYDNKTIWKKYNYRDLGIIGEPYFDLDFNTMLYLTDTGRRWDGQKVSVRDKVEIPNHFKHLLFSTTEDIIHAVGEKKLPDKIMFTFHPQRWTNNPLNWTNEFIVQNSKNLIKRCFFVDRS